MQENAKCFIRIDKGIFEEITYKELEKRRKLRKEYNMKKFIPIDGMLLEVTENEYKDFYKDFERNKYIMNESKRFSFISINKMAKDDDDKDIRETIILPDENVDINAELERKMEIEQVKNALSELNDEEYKLIKALFFEQKSLREYAEITKEVIIIGVGTRLEIWNKDKWKKYNSNENISADTIAENMTMLGI